MEDVAKPTWWRVLGLRARLLPSSLLHTWVRYVLSVALAAAVAGAAVWGVVALVQPAGPGEVPSSGEILFTMGVRMSMLMLACFGVVRYAIRRRPTWYGWRNPRLQRADPDGLRAVVAEAAEMVGWDQPLPVIRLSAWAKVRVWRGPLGIGSGVKLGVPMLMGLTREELRVILVREFILARTVPRRTWFVLVLNSEDIGRAARGEPCRWRPWLREQAYRMRHDLWKATAELVGGPGVLERATRRENLIGHAFSWHVLRYVHKMAQPVYFTDVYRTFRRLLTEDDLLAKVGPGYDAYTSEELDKHELRLVEEVGWRPDRAVEPVTEPVLTDLPADVERRHGRVLLRHYTKDRRLGPRGLSLADITDDQWLFYHEDQLDRLRAAARALLGDSHTVTDLVRLAQEGRARELDWWHVKTVCPHPSRAVCVLLPVLQDGLRRQGYTHADHWRQRVLTGPGGDVVDVVELAAEIAGGDMSAKDPDEDARRLAAESLAGGDATGWFERLYAGSAAGEAVVPWDSGGPHPLLVGWTDGRKPESGDPVPRALVVGAGLGDDAEHLAGLGYDTTAFDVSESAVRLARERFPGTAVAYRAADLLDPPAEWRGAFDLVVEVMTVQALPEPLHEQAIARVASFVRPGGTLLVIASGRDEGDPVFPPPWPLTRAEITAFATGGLAVGEIEDLREPGRRRWRATFHRLAI
ncbi:methyltransferase domain-containing protein [Nonomuraea sp. 3-1Str]|uniref:methyltransferase domain-containing protein n=1 Tax=Nonomuraea sp. 3-1Str TaxID=2929801 RepID=UPI00285EF0B5|nr:methyltransferase domain-containing protein [Nonomuraea sp. 3-1Str]MDR8414465.1 methyltransferase domain-containing protein [Nonomuraea sp. 3-1Str]